LNARTQQKERTRKRLYRIALDAIRRDGLSKASIDEIARAGRVSRGTFYFHFPEKEDVLSELLIESKQNLADALSKLPARSSLRRVVETACAAMASQWQDEPRLFLEVGLLGLRRAGEQIDTLQNDPARSVLAEKFAGMELKSGLPPELLADVFLLQTLAAGMAWTARPEMPLPAVLSAVATLFLEGVE
jgi:AcrR family transcriptional regulator